MILSIANTLDQFSQFSNLSNSGTIGGTVLPIRNVNSFNASYAVQVGKTGEELSEIVNLTASTPTGTALFTSGTLRFDHPEDTPVYNIHYDSIIVKRSTAGTAGTATALATVTITPDSTATLYNDTTGASTYAYKTTFFNSVTSDVSSDSDWIVPGGPTFYSLQSIRNRIKSRMPSSAFVDNDTIFNTWINEWLEQMTNAAIKVNQDFAIGTTVVSFDSNGMGTITATDFKQPRKVEISRDAGITYYKSTKVFQDEYDDRDIFTSLNPRHVWYGDNVFKIIPGQTGGSAKITYYKLNPQMVNETDELPVSMRAYSQSFVDWGLGIANELDRQQADADRMYGRAEAGKQAFINEITPRDQSGPTYMTFDSDLTGDDTTLNWEYSV